MNQPDPNWQETEREYQVDAPTHYSDYPRKKKEKIDFDSLYCTNLLLVLVFACLAFLLMFSVVGEIRYQRMKRAFIEAGDGIEEAAETWRENMKKAMEEFDDRLKDR